MWLEKSKNIHSTKTINNYVGQLKHFNLLVKMGTKEDRWSVIAKFCFVALFQLQGYQWYNIMHRIDVQSAFEPPL